MYFHMYLTWKTSLDNRLFKYAFPRIQWKTSHKFILNGVLVELKKFVVTFPSFLSSFFKYLADYTFFFFFGEKMDCQQVSILFVTNCLSSDWFFPTISAFVLENKLVNRFSLIKWPYSKIPLKFVQRNNIIFNLLN